MVERTLVWCSVVRVVVFCVLAIILVLKVGLMKVEETFLFDKEGWKWGRRGNS